MYFARGYNSFSNRTTTLRSPTIPDALSGTVSCLAFSSSIRIKQPSWDCALRAWQFNNWKAEPKFYTTTQQIPILRFCFDQNVYFGATDGNVYSVSVEGPVQHLVSPLFPPRLYLPIPAPTNSAFRTHRPQLQALVFHGHHQRRSHLKTSVSVTPPCSPVLQDPCAHHRPQVYFTAQFPCCSHFLHPSREGDTYTLISYFDPTQAKTLTMDTLRNHLLKVKYIY